LHYYPSICGDILECCSGQNDITQELVIHNSHRGYVNRVKTNDIDPTMPSDEHWDASSSLEWSQLPFRHDWVISNPPFNVAGPIVQAAFSHAIDGIAMLLRLSFLEPCKGRAEFLAQHPPSAMIVLPRISFTGDGKTDNVTCAWLIWLKSKEAEQPIIVATKELVARL
jgi:hypothetical protein